MARMLIDGEYESNIQSGSHGDGFHKDVALALFLRMWRSSSTLRLGYTVKSADKFDDIMLIDDGNKVIHFIQVKHGSYNKEKVKSIDLEALFPTQKEYEKSKGDFNLCKYLESYLKVKHNFNESEYETKFYILSNKDLNITDNEWVSIDERKDVDEILRFPGPKDRHLKLTPTNKAIKNLSRYVNKDLIKVKEAIKNVFLTGNVSQTLIKYCTPLKEVLTIDKNKKCSFLARFYSEGEQFCKTVLYDTLKKDNFDMTKQVTVEYNFLLGNSRLKRLPQFVSEEVVVAYFHDLTLLVGYPNDFRPIIEYELQKWLRTWIQPDIFGKITKIDMFLTYTSLKNKFEELNEPTVINKKMRRLLQKIDEEEFIMELKKTNKKLEGKETKEFHEFYINRQIKFKAEAEQLTDESITEEDAMFDKCSMEPTDVMDVTMKGNHTVRNTSKCLSHKFQRNPRFNEKKITNLKQMVDFKISDTEFVEELQSRFKYKQFILLVADPGMGKTSLLQFLAFEVQKTYDFHVFLVYFSDLVEKLDKIHKISCFDSMISILQAALSKENCNIITYAAEKRDVEGFSIVLVMDGFDEIHSKYTTKVTDMLKQLETKQSIQIIISARMHVQKLLESTFGIESMVLAPFCEEDQINYLNKMWQVSNTAKQSFLIYSKQLLDTFHSSIPSNLCEIYGLPLMMRMLAETHSEQFEQYLEVVTTNNEQQFDFSTEKLNIVGLYEQFIRKCLHLKLVQKYHRDIDDSELDSMIIGYILEHQLLAMKLLNIEIFEDLCRNVSHKQTYEKFRIRCETMSEKSLLVKVVNNTVQFCHPSYGEYFVAKYLCDNIYKLNSDSILSILSQHAFARKLSLIKLEENEDNFSIWNNLCKSNWKIALWACESGCLNITSSLEENFKSFSTSNLSMMLRISAMNGYSRICELLLKNNADPNKGNDKQWTALHMAAQKGHDQVIRLLIDAGANTNSRTNTAQTLLHIAAENGHKNASELCIANNNDVNAVDDKQRTALHLAASGGHDSVVELLIRNLANEDAQEESKWTALHLAAGKGHDQVIRLLINAGASTNSRTNTGRTPLHIAAANGHKNASELFIVNNNDVNAVDDKQRTALHLAASGGHDSVVELLIRYLANEDAHEERHWTALHLAAQRGHDQVIRLLIDAGAITNSRTNTGQTPLHIAAANGHKNALELFIANNIDVNVVDEEKLTALHLAAFHGHDSVVELLIRKEANVDAQTENKCTALHLAAQRGHDQVIWLLIDAGVITNSRTNTGQTPLHIAAENGHTDASELFIANNNDVNAVDDKQWTVLHSAAHNGHDAVVELLILHLANVDAQTENKCTALHLAAEKGHDQVIRLLIDAGAITNCQSNASQTPLHIAAENGHKNASELFIANNNDVNAVDNEKRTALHLAAHNGHVTLVELLLCNGANVNAQQRNKWTALHLAAGKGHDQVIRLLLNAGAITNSRTNTGRTPLHIAAANGHKYSSELLIANDNDVNAVDDEKWTALLLAAHNGHVTVVELLLQNKADVNAQQLNKWNAFHLAAGKGHDQVIRLLLNTGAITYSRTNTGRTPLHIAAANGHKCSSELFIANDNDVNAVDDEKWTALHLAAGKGHDQVIRLLLNAGAITNSRTNTGRIPLHIAAANGHKYSSELLIANDNDVNAVDDEKWTALLLAAHNGHVTVVELLLENKADVNAQQLNKWTALHLAAGKGHDQVIRLLLDAGAITNSRTNTGRTPLHIASAHDHKDASELLMINNNDVNAAKSGFYDIHDVRNVLKADFVKGFDFEELETQYINRRIRFETATFEPTDVLNIIDDDMDRQSEGSFSHEIPQYSNNQKLSAKASSQKSATTRIISDAEFVEEHREIFKGYQHILLVGESGMGKTSLLKFLGFEFQKQRNVNVLLVHFSDLVKKIDTLKEITNMDDALNILKATLSKVDWHIISSAPDLLYDTNYSIILLLDGFDEIHANYTNRVTEMLQQLSLKNSVRFIISSRAQDTVKLLEKRFNVKPMFLEPFSKKDQISLLRKMWNVTNVDEQRFLSYSNGLLEKFHFSIPSKVYEFSGLPLLLRMLGEIYFDKFKVANAPSMQQFDFSTDKLNIIDLFEQFVRKCFDVKLGEKYQHFGNFGDAEVDILFMDFNLEHQLLAMTLLGIEMPKGLFKNPRFKQIYQNFESRCFKESEKSLLVKVVGNNVQFCHRLYCDFIVAKYICDHIFTLKAKLVISILSGHDDIRRFLMIMLGKTSDFSEILNKLCKLNWNIALWTCESGYQENVFALKDNFNGFSLDNLNMMLHVSAKNGYSMICEFLITYNENLDKFTALYSAVENSRFEVVKLLLKHKTDVNCKKSHCRTPLHVAALNGDADISKMLIDYKANVNAVDEKEWTALHLASEKGHVELLKILLDKGADIDFQTFGGQTPLHIAALNHNLVIAKVLIERSANVDLLDERNCSPLHLACEKGHFKLAELLIEHSAGVNLLDARGCSPLHLASEKGHFEIAELLINIDAEVNMQDARGCSPLHLASEKGHFEIAEFLIEHRAEMNLQDARGCTPLHLASEKGHFEIVEFLIEKGAEVNLQDVAGNTPLCLASEIGHLEVAALLIDRGANVPSNTVDHKKS